MNRENGLHCVVCRVFGVMAVTATLMSLVAIGAWGPLAFIAIGVPIVGWAEQRLGMNTARSVE